MRFKGVYSVALLLVMGLLFAPPLMAQEQRGAIEGAVKDSSGGVLPGVTIEAKNVAVGSVATAVTDANGVYRFPALAPGKYDVTANLAGFATKKFEAVEILLGQIKKADFALTVAGVSETVQVSAETPLVDVRQSARSTSIRSEQIDLLPKGRDFTTIVTQAPGANNEAKSNGVMIDGATTSENRYIVDGAETSDIVSGGSGKTVMSDFIEEVQVKSSGYTAEYGGATGGVINVVTKSGTNNWRGNAIFYYEGDKLQGAVRPTLRLKLDDANQSEEVTYPKDKFSRIEPGFSFGGPLLKDKAWFYAAYQPTFRETKREITSIRDNKTPITGNRKQPAQFLSANQTSQISSNFRTRVAYNNSWSKTDGGLPSLDGSDQIGLSYNYGTKYPNYSVSAQADWVARQNFFVGLRGGYYKADRSTFGVPVGPRYIYRTATKGCEAAGSCFSYNPGIPAQFQQTSGFLNVLTNAAIDKDQQQRASFQVDATWYGHLGGQHTVKGGFQVDRLANSVNSYETGPYMQLYYGQAYRNMQGAYGYYRFRVADLENTTKGFSTTGDVGTNNYGLFVQDAWTISNKLTVNLGLRTENEKIPPYVNGSDIPASAITFGFKDKLAPRLGFAYDIMGDGKWKTYGSWGIFYDIFKMNLARGSFGGEKWLEFWYTLDTPDPSTLLKTGGSCPPACPASMGKLIRGPYDYRAVSLGSDAIDPNLKPMRSQEASFGLEHQLSPVLAVSARYVRKWLDRAVDDTGSFDENGEIYVIANPGFGMTKLAYADMNIALPKAKRNYDGVELALTKNFSKSYYLRFSYLWSRLYGNYSGLDQTDENGRTSPNTGRLYDYPLMSFDQHGNPVEGPLATDRPHQVKVGFIYQLPVGTTVGINQYVASGIPKTREMAVINGSAYPTFYAGRGSDGRMPVYSQTDLQVQHEFKVGGRRAFQISLNVLNLLNQKTATNFFATENKSGFTLDFNEADFYGHKLDFTTLKAAQKMEFDPRFMKFNGYQEPIQARVAFKFLF
jgi:outer membrane receptor protein involved in Fe transport